jgi:hypothetical protein
VAVKSALSYSRRTEVEGDINRVGDNVDLRGMK